ncbi:hypothetical protein ACFWIP_05330, partial [Streptomyces anulatus]
MNPNPPTSPPAPWPPAAWVPPSETEQLLHDAALRGDARAQLAALAGAGRVNPAPARRGGGPRHRGGGAR